MDVVKNILGDTDEEVRMLKEDLRYFCSTGNKAGVIKVQKRLEGLGGE